jgi:hypothetical protein
LRIRLDRAGYAGIMEGEIEVRLIIASRSMLTWLIESVGQ